MLRKLNHITICVSNVELSLDFYIEKLGFKGHVKWDTGAYLTLDDLWFCLSLGKPDRRRDYTHLAFSVAEDDFEKICSELCESGFHQWKKNSSEGQSLYITDPDGHKLEIHVGTLQTRLNSLRDEPYKGLVWL